MNLDEILEVYLPEPVPIEEKLIKGYSVGHVYEWMIDPVVRRSLMNFPIIVVKDYQAIEYGTDSPYKDDYVNYVREYIIPGFINYLSSYRYPPTEPLSVLIYYLLTAAEGSYNIPDSYLPNLIPIINPHYKISKQPKIGNCYFCSIGQGIGLDAETIREDLATKIVEDGIYPKLALEYLRECPQNSFYSKHIDRRVFVEEFPSLIAKTCMTGDTNCGECVWGSNDYDSIIAELYGIPIIGFQIDLTNEGRREAINLEEYHPVIEKFAMARAFRYMPNPIYRISISESLPRNKSYRMVGMYSYHGNHFDAIKYV